MRSSRAIKSVKLTDTLTLSEYKDGYWLYDHTRGMNLAIRAKTETDAFVSALKYYQKKTKKIEARLNELNKAIDTFVSEISDDDDF